MCVAVTFSQHIEKLSPVFIWSALLLGLYRDPLITFFTTWLVMIVARSIGAGQDKIDSRSQSNIELDYCCSFPVVPQLSQDKFICTDLFWPWPPLFVLSVKKALLTQNIKSLGQMNSFRDTIKWFSLFKLKTICWPTVNFPLRPEKNTLRMPSELSFLWP